jgi:hypothetical protein
MSTTAKRIRSLVITVMAIAVANVAISFASGEKSGVPLPDGPRPKSGVPLPDGPRP